jgi:hypothetical protein
MPCFPLTITAITPNPRCRYAEVDRNTVAITRIIRVYYAQNRIQKVIGFPTPLLVHAGLMPQRLTNHDALRNLGRELSYRMFSLPAMTMTAPQMNANTPSFNELENPYHAKS